MRRATAPTSTPTDVWGLKTKARCLAVLRCGPNGTKQRFSLQREWHGVAAGVGEVVASAGDGKSFR